LIEAKPSDYFCHKKAQKTQRLKQLDCLFIFCGFCAFWWLFFFSQNNDS